MIMAAVRVGFGYFQREAGYTRTGSHHAKVGGRETGQWHEAALVMIKSTLRRSIRRAQARDLIGRNVIDLIDLPPGRPGRPSRAMTEEQAGAVLKAARGRIDR